MAVQIDILSFTTVFYISREIQFLEEARKQWNVTASTCLATSKLGDEFAEMCIQKGQFAAAQKFKEEAKKERIEADKAKKEAARCKEDIKICIDDFIAEWNRRPIAKFALLARYKGQY